MKLSLKCDGVPIYKKARCVDALEAKTEKTLLKIKLKPLLFKTKVRNILRKTQNLRLGLSNATWSI